MTDNQEVKVCVNCKHHLFNPYSHIYGDDIYRCVKDFTVQNEKCGESRKFFEPIEPTEPTRPEGPKNTWMPSPEYTIAQKIKKFFK